VLDPSHIWYTPCSGIWQTVWLESAPAERIIKIDLDANMNGFSKRPTCYGYPKRSTNERSQCDRAQLRKLELSL
jgi:hypothetical protein